MAALQTCWQPDWTLTPPPKTHTHGQQQTVSEHHSWIEPRRVSQVEAKSSAQRSCRCWPTPPPPSYLPQGSRSCCCCRPGLCTRCTPPHPLLWMHSRLIRPAQCTVSHGDDLGSSSTAATAAVGCGGFRVWNSNLP